MKTSNWHTLMNGKGSWSEQSRREKNGSRHRETSAINSEIYGDNPTTKVKHGRSVDTKAINNATIHTKIRLAKDAARMAFGPRLVYPNGNAIYAFQVKK